jgi:lysyl-tRNA synthetase class 2
MTDDNESHLRKERRAKLEALQGRGVDPYPYRYADRLPTSKVVDVCRGLEPGASADHPPMRVAGRIGPVRSHGRSAFVDVQDEAGSLQLLLRVDELGEPAYRQWLSDLDPGDIVGAEGVPLLTRRGEPSLAVRTLTLLTKAIAPPPEKFHGLKDPEERIRRRYVDLLSSAETRNRFRARSILTRATRGFLDAEGFLEVETPVLASVASGAAAQPFLTHSNYLNAELQLRISLELPLKRLLVGGLERVYEVGRIFRNEDLDATHSPEFTMLELYWAYEDYEGMAALVERLYAHLAGRVADLLPESEVARGAPEMFRPPFTRVDYVEELERRSGIHGLLKKSREELRDLARGVGATVPDGSTAGTFLDKLFAHYVEAHLDRPTFVLDFPESTTPLAKRHRSKAGRVERFELYCRGVELGNAYSELNDPDEQERRFRAQLSERGEEVVAYDADFVEALRYGMPPATGLGIGVDRMVMALAGIPSIKDVILFPQTRERSGSRPGTGG